MMGKIIRVGDRLDVFFNSRGTTTSYLYCRDSSSFIPSCANMLLQQAKPVKRQSFSIESLAISSRVEQERDTESPYLSYLESQKSSSVTMDHNSNLQHWNEQSYNSRSTEFTDLQTTNFTCDVRLPRHSTSTPKIPQPKRRRLDSASPSSSDDSSERMVIDESNMTSESYPDVEKLSPSSSTTASTSSVSSDIDNDSTCGDDLSRGRKKARTAFTGEQLKELEKRYKTRKYLTAADRTHISKSLKLKEQQVKTWFQNRRMKEKRQQREDEQSRGFSLPTGGVDVAQLAALGICPPPYPIATTNPGNHHYGRIPSPIDMRATTPHHPVTPNGNTSVSPSPIVPHPLRLDNVYKPTVHSPTMEQNVTGSDNTSVRNIPRFTPYGLHAPLAIHPGMHNMRNIGLSQNGINYHYMSHAR